MLIGLDVTPAELTTALTMFPGTQIGRVFAAVGQGIPPWNSGPMSILRSRGVIAWPSFKDWPSDAAGALALTAWLNAIPVDVPQVWLTFHHEPEGDLPSGQYRHIWTTIYQIVRSHHNSPKVKLVPIHGLYPSRHKASDLYNTDWTQWSGVWQQWAPITSTGRYVGDYMGWDCYLETSAVAYEPPESFLRIPVGAALSLGVPLAVPELGAVRLHTDTDGSGRAAWITVCAAYLRAHGAVSMSWWYGTGTNDEDYRLLDQPSMKAWRSLSAAPLPPAETR